MKTGNQFSKSWIVRTAMLALLLSPASIAHAQTPSFNANVTPYSWEQFKQSYGLPSVPTVPETSAQINGATIFPDQGVRSFLLGDYGTTPPPAGSNNFFDLEAGAGDSLEAWTAPFYNISVNSASDIVVDDYAAPSTNPNAGSVTGAVGTVNYDYGQFAENLLFAQNVTNANIANYYGTGYQTAPAVSRLTTNPNSASQARWVPYVTTAGYYTVYAWFPSQSLVGLTPEYHVDDALYSINIKLPNQALTTFTSTVDQQSGGAWVPLGGPHYFPVTTPSGTDTSIVALPTGTGANSFADIRVNNTTEDNLTPTPAYPSGQPVVCADAIELVADNTLATRELSSPVAVNISVLPTTATPQSYTAQSDYPEIAAGYDNGISNVLASGAVSADGVHAGGGPIQYQSSLVTKGSLAIDPTVVRLFGTYNRHTPNANPTVPVDQVVYFTRTETVNGANSNGSEATQVGAVYCANGFTGDVIWRYPSVYPSVVNYNDTSGNFGDVGGWAAQTGGDSYGGSYLADSAIAGGTDTATWTMPTSSPAGKYYVYAYFPSEKSNQPHITAHYVITDAGGVAHNCYVNQAYGGHWVQLAEQVASTSTSLFNLNPNGTTPVSTVVLGNDITVNGDSGYVVANAIEFVPENSMGTTDSTPAVVRNMDVVVDRTTGQVAPRTVVMVADNLGKIYCLDANGNGDGDDTLYDANNDAIYYSSTGVAYEGPVANNIPAVQPFHPLNYGTTDDYWTWQPDPNEPIGSQAIVDDLNGNNAPPSIATPTGPWTSVTTGGYTATAYLNAYSTTPATAPPAGYAYNAVTPAPTTYFTWSPAITQAGAASVYVWYPQQTPAPGTGISDARYTVVDATGTPYICAPQNQLTGGGGFTQLVALSGQKLFQFDTTPNTGVASFAGTKNTIVVDNISTANPTGNVIADAVKVVFGGSADANSNLLPPLAFELNSPTIHTTPGANYIGGDGVTYPTFTGKMYIGNSNGVLYALDTTGVVDGASKYQRDLSQDASTPSPEVDWWYNMGVNNEDVNGEIEDEPGLISQAVAYAPAYYSSALAAGGIPTSATPPATDFVNDQILVTTYSPGEPSLNVDPANAGRLYAVHASGPVGDYGLGPVPVVSATTDYRDAAGSVDYNLQPVPYYSFPDGIGTLKDSHGNLVTLPVANHIPTSQVPSTLVTGQRAAANSLGDIAGAPVVFGPKNDLTNGVASPALAPLIYIAANDPTPDGSAATQGRIYGIDPTTGDLSQPSGANPFIYPLTGGPTSGTSYPLSPNFTAANFNPNTIAQGDTQAISDDYDSTAATADNTPFGPFTDQDATTGYFASSSPAAAIVHTISDPGAALYPSIPTFTDSTGTHQVAPYNSDVPMLFVGDLQGAIHYINVAGKTDTDRFVHDEIIEDAGTPIYSTPLVLANAAGGAPGITGGVVWVSTQDGVLSELESFPYIEDATLIDNSRLLDFQYSGPGGFSSPASAAADVVNNGYNSATTGTTISTAIVDDSEWIYCGSDVGFCYGLTANNTTGRNGGSTPGGFDPGDNIPPVDEPPVNSIVPPDRNFITAIAGKFDPATDIPFTSPTNKTPPSNPVFDWGQTFYLKIYGVDDPTAGTAALPATALTPRALRITFTVKPVGTAGAARTITRTLDLQSPQYAYKITGVWPPVTPPGYTLTSDPAASASDNLLGPDVAVYALQLGDGTSDPQTPGTKEQITDIEEQVQYVAGTTAAPQLVTRTIRGRTNSGSVRRVPSSTDPRGFVDEPSPPVDQATFGILNPIALAGAGRSMGPTSGTSYTYNNLTLTGINDPGLSELGPFSGVNNSQPDSVVFPEAQAAENNGNRIPLTQPVGGSISGIVGSPVFNPNAPSTVNGIDRTKYFSVVVAADAGLISHGSSGTSGSPNTGNNDPSDGTLGAASAVPYQSALSPGTYGGSLLNLADRSALGIINEDISRLRMEQPTPEWNDNSGSGGPMAVINPLGWDNLPTSFNALNHGNSVDYPDMPNSSASVELLPRHSGNATTSLGTDSTITSGSGTLAAAGAGTGSDTTASRYIYPNAALMRVNVRKFQPANLESYEVIPNGSGALLTSGVSHFSSQASDVAQGYVARARIFVDTNGDGQYHRGEAYRDIQVWVGVPVDTSTAIADTTIDVGSVSAGFGLDTQPNSSGSGAPTNDAWSPFQPTDITTTSNAFTNFFRPITIVNNGNVNLVNVHLNQFNDVYQAPAAGYSGVGSFIATVPQVLGSSTNSTSSQIPTFDPPVAGAGLLTGTPNQPIVRSSIDFFDFSAVDSGTEWTSTSASPEFNIYNPNPVIKPASVLVTPGPTLHKPRPGDPTGTVMSVPDTPHGNIGPGTVGNIANDPYQARPVISVAVPLGTAVGTYSQIIRAFEGYDLNTNVYQGPTYGRASTTSATDGFVTYNNGWHATGTPTSHLGVISGGNSIQTTSNPGVVVKLNVIESRITGGAPMGTTTTNNYPDNPDIDSGVVTNTSGAGGVANNDVQPWAFYDPSALSSGAGSSTPAFGLLWTSGRKGTTSVPFTLFGSALASVSDQMPVPTYYGSGNSSPTWWSAAAQLTDTTPPATGTVESYGASTISAPDTIPSSQTSRPTAIYVSATANGNSTLYTLYNASIQYTSASQPEFVSPTALFTSTTPIINPRASWYYPVGATIPAGISLSGSETVPFIFYTTRIGGRSTAMYWPSISTPGAGAAAVIQPAPLPVPKGLTSVTNATGIARILTATVANAGTPTSTVTYPVIDVTYSGVSSPSNATDIYTSRFAVNLVQIAGVSGSAPATLNLLPVPTLPTIASLNFSRTSASLNVQTEPEVLSQNGQSGVWEAQDVSWLRDPAAFELFAQVNTVNNDGTVTPNYIALVPGASKSTYDKASGQWVFTLNWNTIVASSENSSYSAQLNALAYWWTGATGASSAPNITVYVNPDSGTVRFGTPMPTTTVLVSGLFNFVGLTAYVNPATLRATFHQSVNSQPIAFLDNQYKPNDAPGEGVVQTTRYWYIFRRVASGLPSGAAHSSTLYYDTRRLTMQLSHPVALTLNSATNTYSVSTPITVFDLSSAPAANITSLVDIDWARGRIYFPDQFEGHQIKVDYRYIPAGASTSSSTSDIGTAIWMDEPNNNAATTSAGGQPVPINAPVNESEPAAFLDPYAGAGTVSGSTVTLLTNPEALQVAPGPFVYPHKVWLFWTSTRNAPAKTGSDVYWETLDPLFDPPLP